MTPVPALPSQKRARPGSYRDTLSTGACLTPPSRTGPRGLLVVASMPAALVSASVVASIPAFVASVPSVKTLIASSGPSPAGQRVLLVGTNLVSPTGANFGTTATSIASSTATPATSSTDQYSYLATSPPESAATVALIGTAASLSSARASSPVAPICGLSSTRRATQLRVRLPRSCSMRPPVRRSFLVATTAP